jgi:uncharacterized DUF497 family protein
MGLQFEWDRQKARTNLQKHGVSFDEAATVFNDPTAFIFDDLDHSTDEQREIIIGHSAIGHILVISFTERDGEKLRIISARKATKLERSDYEENTKI